MKNSPDSDFAFFSKISVGIFVVLLAGIVAALWATPHYRVWQQGMLGKAMLEKAEQEKRITIETAKAKLEASTLDAESEIERAKGLSKSIEIVGEMAKKYPEYRHQQFIEGFAEALREGKISQVIYVPTEANLPILEAKHR